MADNNANVFALVFEIIRIKRFFNIGKLYNALLKSPVFSIMEINKVDLE